MSYYRHHGPISIGCIFFLIMLLLILHLLQGCSSEITWNDGKCPCGGHYIYKEAIGHHYTTEYAYVCDTCGNRIEISTYYKEN